MLTDFIVTIGKVPLKKPCTAGQKWASWRRTRPKQRYQVHFNMNSESNGRSRPILAGDNAQAELPDEPMVFIIIGEVRRSGEKDMFPFNALLIGPDDDTAVRSCLEALAQEGYEEADLHQIGNLEGRPEEDPFVSAYDAPLEGEVAIIAFEGGYDLDSK